MGGGRLEPVPEVAAWRHHSVRDATEVVTWEVRVDTASATGLATRVP